ncbi:amidohydrolase [Luteimonas sp. e5]
MPSHAADGGEQVMARVDAYAARMGEVSRSIWQRPELGYLETHASGLLQQELRAAGFEVEAGVAGMPTAFVARAGEVADGPVIALLAEMDALPGMAQAASPLPQPLAEGAAGHACGHNLFGAASVAAAIALHDWLRTSGVAGQVRVYGTPAEEGGSGKVFMVKAGLFDDVDAVLHWHPDSRNSAVQGSSLANINGRFRFSGVASHASIAPERGRSALDGGEALNFMANLMREHVPPQTRIHYTINDGGGTPNVVPARAEVHYYVRHPDHRVVLEVMQRLHAAAEGAAQGTGTTVEFRQIGGVYDLLPNDVLGRVADAALRRVGGVDYDADDLEFARRMQATFQAPPALSVAATIAEYEDSLLGGASTDVGDVSWVVPTVGLSTATWVPGTAAHSWQAVAASGHAIGEKGAAVAAKALALIGVELFTSPDLLAQARAEFERRRGAGFRYRSLIEGDTPPLDYRLP